VGIDGIDILKPDGFTPQVRERKAVSNYTVVQQDTKYVYGWDQQLLSFFLQVHDLTLPEDDQIIAWYGATGDTIMYEVADVVRVAAKHGLSMDSTTQVMLFADKDDGA